MKFAIDFDGTIAVHEYPKIGKEVPEAINTLHALQEAGHKINLFTMRSGVELQEAVDWCKDRGIIFDGIQKDKGQGFWTKSPKCFANMYIDDAAFGCPLIYESGHRPYVDWVVIQSYMLDKEILRTI